MGRGAFLSKDGVSLPDTSSWAKSTKLSGGIGTVVACEIRDLLRRLPISSVGTATRSQSPAPPAHPPRRCLTPLNRPAHQRNITATVQHSPSGTASSNSWLHRSFGLWLTTLKLCAQQSRNHSSVHLHHPTRSGGPPNSRFSWRSDCRSSNQ